MKLPSHVGDNVTFRCNICGTSNNSSLTAFHREAAFCSNCRSVARFRGIVYALSQAVYGRAYPLTDMPRNKSVRGIGMSDSTIYASGLASAFDYTNTYYHTEPRLDVTRADLARYKDLDFIITTDVLEHIILPLEPAFNNMRAMLRTGGILIISVPYSSSLSTTEHFPNINQFKIIEFTTGEWIVLNRARNGQWEIHENVIFHGGPGTTLEMRVFSETDLVRHICSAGFEIERIYNEPILDIGYYWPPLHERDFDIRTPVLGHIIAARAI
jgi:hypothetical protein